MKNLKAVPGKSLEIEQKIYDALHPTPTWVKGPCGTFAGSKIVYGENKLEKYNKWCQIDKNYKKFIAEKILKICIENKFIFITGTSVLNVGEGFKNDNVISFSTFDRGSVELEKEEMQIYRYALRWGVNTTKKGMIFKTGCVCFNPHSLGFPTEYLQEGWKNN